MQRLIDADALIPMMKYATTDSEIGVFPIKIGFNAIIEVINNAPTIDAEPVRHGKWKWLSCTYDRVPKEKEYECSECHHKTIVHGDDMPWEKYCPQCGCRMDGERKEE